MKSCDDNYLSGDGSFTKDKKHKVFNDSTNSYFLKNDDSAAFDICNEKVQSTTDNVKKGELRAFSNCY